MSCISAHDPQLMRLADAIAQRVGQQRFHVWFNNSTRLDLKHDSLEIAVPNDFISEWIGAHFAQPIQEAAHEVFGGPLIVRFSVMPQLFALDRAGAAAGPAAARNLAAGDPSAFAATRVAAATKAASRLSPRAATSAIAEESADSACAPSRGGIPRSKAHRCGQERNPPAAADRVMALMNGAPVIPTGPSASAAAASQPMHLIRPAIAPVMRITPRPGDSASAPQARPRLRHVLENFVVGQSNQLAYNAAAYVAEFPGVQYNPLFIHGNCGLGKTHLLQGLCKRFLEHHPTKRWIYLTGEEFTNDFLSALRNNKLDSFRRRMRDLDLLVIDDVHFLGGKKATQEEFLHTFNAIEAMGRQVVMASDNHPKMIEEFGESLINRFVSGMVVRIDPPNFATRCEILRALSVRNGIPLPEEVVAWIARRVAQSVRELEGAVTRIAAHVQLAGRPVDAALAQEALGDLDRHLVAPVRPENIMQAVCNYFSLEHKDLMSGRRQRTISLARSVAMYLIRKTAKLSFPEIGIRMGKRNHSTVISACRRVERAASKNELLVWTSTVGDREEEATELLQRLEEHSRAMGQ